MTHSCDDSRLRILDGKTCRGNLNGLASFKEDRETEEEEEEVAVNWMV